jgi:hypothetical protein
MPLDSPTPPSAGADQLREALKPFADEADRWTSHTPDSAPARVEVITAEGWDYSFTIGDLRRAREALAKSPAPQPADEALVERVAKMAERLCRKVQVQPPFGSGSISSDGKFSSEITDDGRRYANPDGPAAADLLETFIKAIGQIATAQPTAAPGLADELEQLGVVHGCRTERDYVEVPLELRDRILAYLRSSVTAPASREDGLEECGELVEPDTGQPKTEGVDK